MTLSKQPVTATAQPSFHEGKERGNISIERCSSGRDHESACVIMYKVVPPGVFRFDSVEPGSAVIRLWYPSGMAPELFISGAHSDKPRESLGRRTEKVVETLTFSGSSEATISKPFSAGGITVLATSVFIGKDGSGAAAPTLDGYTFRTKEPAYGAVVVEYEAAYDAHRIYYGLPDWVTRRAFFDPTGQTLAARGEGLEHITIPPVLVMAYAKGQAAQAQIERKIAKVTPAPCAKNEWVTDPGASTVVTYKVYEEGSLYPDGTVKPNPRYITTKAYLKHVECCKAEPTRQRKQEFMTPQGRGIEIVSIGQGSI